MFVNRDIGDDVSCFVGASRATAELLAESFLRAMELRLGHPRGVTLQ
jgi:hypothetical protein